MSSPNISFDNIPSSIRKPGQYFEFNTRLAVRTLPANAQKVLILGQMIDTGTQPPLTPVSVFSADEAAVFFGYGSQAHLMVLTAISTYAYLDLTVIGISDATAGVAASGTLTVTGTASAQGVVSLWVGDTRVDVAVSAADTDATIAAAMKTAIDNQPELPVKAAVASGVLTLTAKNKGAAGNDIRLKAQTTATGTTAVIVAMASGATDPDIAPALSAVISAGHNILVSPFSTQAALTALRTHLDFVSGPMEQRGAVGAAGWTGTLAAGTTLASSINSGRISMGWHNGSVKLPAEVAAAYGARIASEEDPARPLNTLSLALDVTGITSRPGRTEQENALHNGLTPFEVGPGDTVQIVRAVTTYTRNASGVDDVALLDLTTIRTLDYVRKACRERIALRFPRDKLSSRTAPLVESELYDVLLKLEELEIVEEVVANKAALIVERDRQDNNRLNARIPADVVNGLHVFAGRIDLYL
ncbi:TPA: phage tail sheath subtilisin-like domain-containing protein [Escherichia coli]|nr:phage tail sheath subtilisin-like domain-containing protein [Escherichia coli]HCG2937304.1 phage tail sheath subtilisin-like domain-containing protein [Escherichia coli]HCG3100412.1 phage tail sheath subtilisin-like domain-containing protein [Escherichia coli]